MWTCALKMTFEPIDPHRMDAHLSHSRCLVKIKDRETTFLLLKRAIKLSRYESEWSAAQKGFSENRGNFGFPPIDREAHF